ncbi:MAG: hypothetical protein KJZ47_14790 [Gemmatimonadales bacterium]|nr:hypothetical protein [Gemmatimonadales bacterium]
MPRRALIVALASLTVLAAGIMVVQSRRTDAAPLFHPSSPSLVASTGRPQLVEFFHHL